LDWNCIIVFPCDDNADILVCELFNVVFLFFRHKQNSEASQQIKLVYCWL